MNIVFKTYLRMVFLVSASEAITLSLLLYASQIYNEPIFQESSDIVIATGNTFYLILSSLAVSAFFLWIMRNKLIKLEYVFMIIRSLLCGTLFWVIVELLFSTISPLFEYVTLGASSLIFILTYVSAIKELRIVSTFFSLWMTGASAFLLKIIFSNIAIGILLVGFSLFDIYDVYKGPLKHLIQGSFSKTISPLLIKVDSVEVGMGDFLFYSLSIGLAYGVGGITLTFLSFITIKAGILATLKLLGKRPTLPGLPIPVLISVFVISLASLAV